MFLYISSIRTVCARRARLHNYSLSVYRELKYRLSNVCLLFLTHVKLCDYLQIRTFFNYRFNDVFFFFSKKIFSNMVLYKPGLKVGLNTDR